MSALADPCAFCRVGSCAIHGVRRFVAYGGRKDQSQPPDEDMAPVHCCDEMSAWYALGLFRMHRRQLVLLHKGRRSVVVRCPFCLSEERA